MTAHLNNISWPSLYSPAKEVGFIGIPTRPGAYYLSNPGEIFKFTFYWTLIFHLPFNFVAGCYAFFNFLFPPVRSVRDSIALESVPVQQSHSRMHSWSQAHSRSSSQQQSQVHSRSQSQTQQPDPRTPIDEWLKPPRLNAGRSRLTFALLVFVAFLVISLLSAVLGAAVLAFVIVGVYRSGGFYVSTWIPFIWAVIQSLISFLEIWPSVIDII